MPNAVVESPEMKIINHLFAALKDAMMLEGVRVPRNPRRMEKLVARIKPAIDGIALIRGNEKTLVELCNSTNEEVKSYAFTLLMYLHPQEATPLITLRVPWHKPMMVEFVLGLAFNTLGETVLSIADGFDEDAYRRSFGYDTILREAPLKTETQKERATAYFAAVAKLDEAKDKGDYHIVGYIPPPVIKANEQILPGLESCFDLTA